MANKRLSGGATSKAQIIKRFTLNNTLKAHKRKRQVYIIGGG